jgi:hypothetical protein
MLTQAGKISQILHKMLGLGGDDRCGHLRRLNQPLTRYSVLRKCAFTLLGDFALDTNEAQIYPQPFRGIVGC